MRSRRAVAPLATKADISKGVEARPGLAKPPLQLQRMSLEGGHGLQQLCTCISRAENQPGKHCSAAFGGPETSQQMAQTATGDRVTLVLYETACS